MNHGSDPVRDLIVESGLDPEEFSGVADLLESVRGLEPEHPPVPSRELAALLARGVVTPLPVQRHHRGGHWPRAAIVSAAVAATVALGTSVAAASNTLPEPAQRLLSDLSDKYLPFHIPSPGERDDTWRPDVDPLSQSDPGQRGVGKAKGTKARPAVDLDDPAVQEGLQPGGAGDPTAVPGVPADPEMSPTPDAEADAQDVEKEPKPDTGKPAPPDEPAEPAGHGQGSNSSGGGKGRGVVEPPKGKPTAPPGPGSGAGGQAQTPPEEADGGPAATGGKGVEQSGRETRSSQR